MRALEDFQNLAIRASARFDARDADQGAVAVHGLARRIGRDVDVPRDALDRPVGDELNVVEAHHAAALPIDGGVA